MNTGMLLTAVLRKRRSQWTLLPKAEPTDAGAASEEDVHVAELPAEGGGAAGHGRVPARPPA